MEMASWDGGISRTVQFLVPQVCYRVDLSPGQLCMVLLTDVAGHTALDTGLSLLFNLSGMSDRSRPRGLQPARLLCPWVTPGKNAGVGIHSRGSSQLRDQTRTGGRK